ncbi:MAG: hypothetical protein HFH95_04155 [Lachnospiraceae bacterium]|nr:hypothetical protein [uncultured Acetatifactor sp.]MCI8542496.1 hypothetical protein [Lachnospiraceae bacterium]
MAKGNTIRRSHKDTVFNDLFSDKRNALSLFNALNDTDYQDADSLEVVTLSDAIYIHGKNDVSVLFQNQLTLWERQSTLNYNMPLRGLIYYAHNIDGILEARGMKLYGKKLVKIPAPDYYVFYNGREDAPDRQELKLSDAFLVPKEGYEWTAHMLNINRNGNQNLLQRCPALKGYVALIQYVREYQKSGDSLPEAMDKAIDRCTKEGMLKEYLLKKKAEVKLMLLTEFDEEAFAETMREEGREEGEKRLNQLYLKLVEEKRGSDLERAVRDKVFRDTLFERYDL